MLVSIHHKIAGFMAIRFTRPSRALLAMQHDASPGDAHVSFDSHGTRYPELERWKEARKRLVGSEFRATFEGAGGGPFMEAFAINGHGIVCWSRRAADESAWTRWVAIPQYDSFDGNRNAGYQTVLAHQPVCIGRVAAGARGDSHTEAFALAYHDRGIYHAWRDSAADSGWHGWTKLDGDHPFLTSLVVARDASGFLNVFALRRDGLVLTRRQKDEIGVVGWNSWSGLPALGSGSLTGTPCVAVNQDGRLELFACDTAGRLWHIGQKPPGSGFVLVHMDPARLRQRRQRPECRAGRGRPPARRRARSRAPRLAVLPLIYATPAILQGPSGILMLAALDAQRHIQLCSQSVPGSWTHDIVMEWRPDFRF